MGGVFRKAEHAAVGGGNVALNILFVSVPHTAKIAMGARAEAGVFLKLPVFQIMAGFKARLCEIGDLVLDIAVLLQKLHRLKVHIRLLLVSGRPALSRTA